MNRMSHIIRKLTIPPVFVALLLIIMYAVYPDYFGNVWQLAWAIIFLAVFPALAYPLQKYIPHFKNKGRDGQRSLAMIFSAIGYVLGTGMAYILSVSTEIKIVYLEYLFCGIAMLVFNKGFKLKASGHACGIVGPVLLLGYFRLYIAALIGALLIIPVYISSIRTKRHTVSQLIGGTFIVAAMLCIVHFIMV